MRVLIVTNMHPSPSRPELGSFVADQVAALRRIPEVELELFAFVPGAAGAYLRAAAGLARHRFGHREPYDVVHAHFGLTIWPALAERCRIRAVTLHGTDLANPRSRRITLAGPRFIDLMGLVSEALARELDPTATAGARGPRLPGRLSGPTCCSPPIPRARRSVTIWPSRSPAGTRCNSSRWATSPRPRSRCGSMPPTPCWSHPIVKGSASRCWRHSRATSRCSPPRSESTPKRSPACPGPTAVRLTSSAGIRRSPPTCLTATRGSTAATAHRSSPPTGWPRAWLTPGGSSSSRRELLWRRRPARPPGLAQPWPPLRNPRDRIACLPGPRYLGAWLRVCPAGQSRHRDRQATGQRAKGIAALQHRPDRGRQLVADSAHRAGHRPEPLIGDVALGERILPMGVTAGRDQDQLRREGAGQRRRHVLDQRAVDIVARARPHRQVDREPGGLGGA